MDRGIVVTRTVGEVCRGASKPYFWSLLLFKLIRKFRPCFCLELGTCLGISTSFQAAALKLNGMGKIVTLEGAKSLASLAERHFQALGLDNANIVIGRFQDTLGEVLNAYKSVDYVFIDGHHDEKATLAYYEQIKPFLSERALLVFDDISWSEGMKGAWKTIMADERVKISVDLRQIGVCIIDSRIDGRKNIMIPMV
jgi:predicted O-methyltransferase YrrM